MAANNLQFGPIQLQHLVVHNACHPAGNTVSVPDDATNCQAAMLDCAIAQVENEDVEVAAQRNNVMWNIRMEFNGTIINVRVDVRSLREALGLPQHDIFHAGIYNQYQHQVLAEGDNIEDVDHQNQDENEQ